MRTGEAIAAEVRMNIAIRDTMVRVIRGTLNSVEQTHRRGEAIAALCKMASDYPYTVDGIILALLHEWRMSSAGGAP